MAVRRTFIVNKREIFQNKQPFEGENLKIDKRFLKMEEKSFDPSKLAKFLIQAGEAIKNLQESAKKDEPCQNCRKSDNLLDEKKRELAAEKAKTKRLTEVKKFYLQRCRNFKFS